MGINQANIDNHEPDSPPEGIDLSDVNFSGFGDSLSELQKDNFFYEVYYILDACESMSKEKLFKEIISFRDYWMPHFEYWLNSLAEARQEEIESGWGRQEE